MRLDSSLMLFAAACICTACATQSYTPDTPSEARQLNISSGDEIRVACAYRPMVQHPAEAVRPEYASYDCSQLDAAILKIDTVRWVIRDDGGELETSGHKAARYAGNFLMIPLSLGAGGPVYLNDGGHAVAGGARTADGGKREPGPTDV